MNSAAFDPAVGTGATSPRSAMAPGREHSQLTAPDSAHLQRLMQQRRLFDKQPRYYTFKILLTLGLLVIGLVGLAAATSSVLQVLLALYLGFVFGQIGFVGHDAGHRQIAHAHWKNDLIGLVCGPVLLGLSASWWIGKHSLHHAHPNQIGIDPDTNIPVLAFSSVQLDEKRGLVRMIVKYQAILFFPMLLVEAFHLRLRSIISLLERRATAPRVEAVLLGLHYVLYVGFLLCLFSPAKALLLAAVQQAFFGLYTGSTFAPNHKGMPMLEKVSALDTLHRQILTARNVKGNFFVDFWYGALNYQIEHHLFPTMPRNNLRRAKRIVEAFCEEHGIPYAETGVVQSFAEVLRYLHQIVRPLYTEVSK